MVSISWFYFLLQLVLLKGRRVEWFCFLGFVCLLFPVFYFFFILSNYTYRFSESLLINVAIKHIHFIWNLTWGESYSRIFCFLTVNNNAVMSFFTKSFLFFLVCTRVELCTFFLLQSLYIMFSTTCYVTGIPVDVGVRFIIKPLDYSLIWKHAVRK